MTYPPADLLWWYRQEYLRWAWEHDVPWEDLARVWSEWWASRVEAE